MEIVHVYDTIDMSNKVSDYYLSQTSSNPMISDLNKSKLDSINKIQSL
jgi:hypothetical protein